MPRTVIVTGSEGYLASQLITGKLLTDREVSLVIGVDIRERSVLADRDPRYRYLRISVTDLGLAAALEELIPADRSGVTVVHTAWTFNPTKDIASQDAVDIGGTRNVLKAARELGIPHVFYLGSTTAYAPLPENPSDHPFMSEDDWESHALKRMSTGYRYSRNKAIAHRDMLDFAEDHPTIITGWILGSIVIGPRTRNVVSYVAESPFTFGRFMFRIAGYDPPMQFISEDDMLEAMYRATMERWRGPVNVAGKSVVRYREVIRIMGRREIALPAWILYPAVRLMWRLGVLDFPPELLDLIRYPWVGEITRARIRFGFIPKHTSREALEQFARSRLGRPGR